MTVNHGSRLFVLSAAFFVGFLLLISCASEHSMEQKVTDVSREEVISTILGGACSLDPKFQYLFEIQGDQIHCKRWPLGEPERAVVKRGSAKPVLKICERIFSELPEAKPPFEPSSIQFQLRVKGKKERCYDTHPPHALLFEILNKLSELYQ